MAYVALQGRCGLAAPIGFCGLAEPVSFDVRPVRVLHQVERSLFTNKVLLDLANKWLVSFWCEARKGFASNGTSLFTNKILRILRINELFKNNF